MSATAINWDQERRANVRRSFQSSGKVAQTRAATLQEMAWGLDAAIAAGVAITPAQYQAALEQAGRQMFAAAPKPVNAYPEAVQAAIDTYLVEYMPLAEEKAAGNLLPLADAATAAGCTVARLTQFIEHRQLELWPDPDDREQRLVWLPAVVELLAG
ncbi:MAG TPA: hypothetical protein PKH77_11725 [Anaerolineae bacterium]|nr:hypothetical protein [Anaerolineae bacterium]